MSTTTKEKLDEMMVLYKKRIDLIDDVIYNIESRINKLSDRKELLENDVIEPLKNQMDEILASMNHSGSLYKNKYYGVEDLQGWAWYKSTSYTGLTYVDDNTFTIPGIARDIKAGQYVLIKDSKYGYMERYVKKVENYGTFTKIYLHESKGPLSNPISEQQPYLSHMNLYPSCENPGKMPERTDCCDYDDKEFDTCADASELKWKTIQTEGLSGSGTQQIEVEGGLKPYTWWLENTNDFHLQWDQTESTKNILTYNYKGTGSRITVTDYCKSTIEANLMPQDYYYLPGVFRITIIPQIVDIDNYVVFINISSNSGINNLDLTNVFDEIGEDWRKLYIKNENETELLYTEVTYWDPLEKRAGLWVKVPFIEKNKETILVCRYGKELKNNDTHIWQIYNNTYPNPPGIIYPNATIIHSGVWNGESSKSNMNFECVNDYCIYNSSDTTIDLIMDSGGHWGNMETKRHIDDKDNLIEKGYNNIRNALSNKKIIVGYTYVYGDILYEKFNTYNYNLNNEIGWAVEFFIKRQYPFGKKITTEEERDEYIALGIAGANGPKDEFLITDGYSQQMEASSIYWHADTGKLVFRYPKQYDGGNWEYPERNTYVYFESNQTVWSDDWIHIAYICDNINATLKLYINGKLDNTYDIIWQQYFSYLEFSMSHMNAKQRATGWSYWRRVSNWCFLTIDNFRYYNYKIDDEIIAVDYINLKDELCKYERIALPKREEI